ncbi:futalosine hydrolase [Paenibacillus arenilitoris]|uniref:Futalosine hydrolase n=1 Tax=Paenibacillus arenilitoris TaxID=2772299 RepID=A0A927H641_9BACL|nr:futalosine hydrolase [Paenibacillus arenilitoris]MBD2868174.1 futalosine hydrolase [Paenibacillus arenilitoris]
MTQNIDRTPALGETGERGGRVLIVTAVEAEKAAIMRGLGDADGIDVITAGVGPAAAAAETAAALAGSPGRYRFVLSAGIGGGFEARAAIGSLVVSSEIIAADLGAETPDGFLSVDELGFGSAAAAVSAEWSRRLHDAILSAGLPVCAGPVATVSTATGSAESAAALAKRIPGAAAEGMEGYGVAVAAMKRGVPAAELRAISNAVGPRDRAAWRIGDALSALEAASQALREVFLP